MGKSGGAAQRLWRNMRAHLKIVNRGHGVILVHGKGIQAARAFQPEAKSLSYYYIAILGETYEPRVTHYHS